MPPAINRVLQIRIAGAVRARLERDLRNGLASVASLSFDDREMLRGAGGGRIGALAITLRTTISGAGEQVRPIGHLHALALGEVARRIERHHVRSSDVVLGLGADTLVILAPELDPIGGRHLATRLEQALSSCVVTVEQVGLEVRAAFGAAYRSPASSCGWTLGGLAAEAQQRARLAQTAPQQRAA